MCTQNFTSNRILWIHSAKLSIFMPKNYGIESNRVTTNKLLQTLLIIKKIKVDTSVNEANRHKVDSPFDMC